MVYDGLGRLISHANPEYKDLLYTISKQNACCASHFDLLRKPDSSVPMYADESGLLVFGAPLTSVRLSNNKFFRQPEAAASAAAFFADLIRFQKKISYLRLYFSL